MKVVNSWSKPDGVDGLIGRKQIDKSMLLEGSHIPMAFHEEFAQANGGQLLALGEIQNVTLVYEGDEYAAKLTRTHRKDRNGERLAILHSGSFSTLLKERLPHSYHQFVEKGGAPAPPAAVPEADREYIEFYKTGQPYRYGVWLVPRPVPLSAGETPPDTFEQVWAHLGQIFRQPLAVHTLSNHATNTVRWLADEGMEVATGQGINTVDRKAFAAAWEALTTAGALQADQLPAEARYRSTAITTILAQLPYVDYAVHPKIALFLKSHLFNNHSISETFGVGIMGGIRTARSAAGYSHVVFITSSQEEEERDRVKNPYHDRWEGELFYYTGEGLQGAQTLTKGNLALQSNVDGDFPLYGFRKLAPNQYVYMGRFRVQEVTEAHQPDNAGNSRRVYIFTMKALDRSPVVALPVQPDPILDLASAVQAFGEALTASHISFGTRHEEVVRSFVASLATKRLAILTGLSGSGKTQIALRFGDWLGEERRMVVPVRPDWTGPEHLFGYEDVLLPLVDGSRAWHVPPVLRFILKAAHNLDHPYLLVLDEMNLAHVERYFADFLSGIESREPCLPNLTQDAGGNWFVGQGSEERISLPTNLFVVGTVNIDETTYMFSPKVLDRANTFEFRVSAADLLTEARKPEPCMPGDDALVRGFLAIARDDQYHLVNPATGLDAFTKDLRTLHEILTAEGFEFGHRVFYEGVRFVAMLEAAGANDPIHALDLFLMQKVLPRIHGTRKRLEPIMSGLGQFSFTRELPRTLPFDPLKPPEGNAQLPRTFDKIQRMTKNLRINQFASFTE